MICPVCGADNEREARFCFRCGGALHAATSVTGPTKLLREGAPQNEHNLAPPASSTIFNPPPPPAANQSGRFSGPDVTGGAQQYVVPESTAMPLTNSLAVASLVLSALSFVLLPIIGAILGIVLGYQARREIKTARPQQTGEGLATAGIILGWINVALALLVGLVICVLLGLGLALADI